MFFIYGVPPQIRLTLFPYTTLFRSVKDAQLEVRRAEEQLPAPGGNAAGGGEKSPAAADAELVKLQKALADAAARARSEEHTSELQSPVQIVCCPVLVKEYGGE